MRLLWIFRNVVVTLRKEYEASQKSMEKTRKALDEVIRERDTIHKEFKKIESMYSVASLKFKTIICTFSRV